jgi:hypothetical protein
MPGIKTWMILFGAAVVVLTACGPDLDEEIFKVYLHPDKGEKEYFGEVKGISRCRERAATRALYINLREGEWSYACCLKSDDSECIEK